MKGLWIRVEAHAVDSVLIAELAEMLGIEPVLALGHLTALGGAVAEHTDDGLIGNLPNTTIETWARWRGKRGDFARATREVLQDGDGRLAEWQEAMGKLVEKRERERSRKEKERVIQKLMAAGMSEEEARKVHGLSADNTRTVRGESVATERDGTERKGEGKTAPPRNPKTTKPDILEAGELVNRIKALQIVPPQGAPYIPRTQVAEQFSDEVVRVFDALGGGKRFVESSGRELAFLTRDLAQALLSARSQGQSA